MLRSINLGAHNRIKMPALVAVFDALGHTDVVTYIQSGNVVFKSRSKSTTALALGIERGITQDLGLDVSVLIRSKQELADVVRANPFLAMGADVSKLHVTFLAEKPDAALVRAIETFDAGADELQAAGREVYVHCPGGYGNTKLSGTFIERRLKAVSTTRNWNTVTKLLELAS
jgi:uncharacterized protein (DUF1697 family)